MEKFLIFNADDFGASSGVNRGIVDCHVRGVLTSTSLMVTGQAVDEAVALSREHPRLSIGLHWDVWGEAEETAFDFENPRAVRDDFEGQLDRFHALLGRMPSHLDSHRHAHRHATAFSVIREIAERLQIPLREDGQVRFVGKFYAQWEWKVTELKYVSVPFLQEMLRTDVKPGFTEFSCHPGYVSPDYQAIYLREREAEVATLTDPAIRQAVFDEGIHLISYGDYGWMQRQLKSSAAK